MSFIRGKRKSIKVMLEESGYVKLDKGTMEPGVGVEIDGVYKGESAQNGTFIYVSGLYKENMVFVSVPAASIEDFINIDDADMEEIRSEKLKMYVEKHTSQGTPPRDYFIAYIDV